MPCLLKALLHASSFSMIWYHRVSTPKQWKPAIMPLKLPFCGSSASRQSSHSTPQAGWRFAGGIYREQQARNALQGATVARHPNLPHGAKPITFGHLVMGVLASRMKPCQSGYDWGMSNRLPYHQRWSCCVVTLWRVNTTNLSATHEWMNT